MFHARVLGFSTELGGDVRHPRPSLPSERPGLNNNNNAPTGAKGASLGARREARGQGMRATHRRLARGHPLSALFLFK
jgi:hypothetical protein